MNDSTNNSKITVLLRSLLSGATDRDADTLKRREKGAARFDKAYLGIVAYVSKLEKDLAAYKASHTVASGLAKQQIATLRTTLKEQDKEIARLMKAGKR